MGHENLLLTKTSYSNSEKSNKISLTLIQRLKRELEEVKNCVIERPARYYHAYRRYTLAYNITLIRGLQTQCSVEEGAVITALLTEYENILQSLK